MKNGCTICTYWTPEKGCRHFLPDSKTVLEAAGYIIKENTKSVSLKKDGKKHRFNSMAKAAHVLVHSHANDRPA